MAESVLHKTGAILFRGFSSAASASDFNNVIEEFGFEELPYVGGATPCTNIVDRVFTSNESPDQKFHSITKWLRMKQKYPEFVDRLEEHGLIYTRVLGKRDDPSSPIGRGWVSTFLTKDKTVAEERAAKLGMKLEWTDDGVKTVMGPIPAIKFDESRQRKIWFNSMVAAYTSWEDARNDPVKAVTFGDGTPFASACHT